MSLEKSQDKSFVEIAFTSCEIINVKTMKNFIHKINVKFIFLASFLIALFNKNSEYVTSKMTGANLLRTILGWPEKKNIKP